MKKSESRTALAVMAHPDDIEFLCAGTLARLHDKGWQILMATMTAGDCGSKTLPPEKISRVRKREALRSARILRAKYCCMGFLDLRIFYDVETLADMIELVRLSDPTLIITHSPDDYMLDHEMTSRLVRAAAFGAPIPNFNVAQTSGLRGKGQTGTSAPLSRATSAIPHLYYADAIEGRDIFGDAIRPHFHVDVTATMRTKERMLKCHASQRAWLRAQHGVDEYVAAMRRWTAARGREAGVDFAEAFRQHRGHAYPQNNLLAEILGGL